MKRKLVTILLAILIAGAGVGGYEIVSGRDDNTPKASTTVTKTQPTGKIAFSADKKQVSYTGATGKTALENLQVLTSVEATDTSYGKMVVAINGHRAEGGKNYWAFYVNGAYANEGAGTYKTQANDQLMWKLEDITQ
jgi:hypothetical protein